MTIYRIITICGLITAMAAGYVHQRVEIIKLGYSMHENKWYLSRLVDQNSKLMYNLSKLESPRNLLISLDTEKIEFASQRTALQKSYFLTRAESENTSAAEAKSVIGRFLDVFTAKAEAEPRR